METRIALIGIIVENPESIEALNHLLHEYGKYIIGRMGIPYREREVNIISVAIDAPQEGGESEHERYKGMGLEPKPFTQISKERMKNKIRCAGQDYLATLQAEPARIRCASSRCWAVAQ